jgi:hypothetical protein
MTNSVTPKPDSLSDGEGGHTPGPWEIAGPNGYGDIDGHRVRDPRGYILAVAIGDVPELSPEANARLIASAPDLLEALKELRDRLQAFVGALALTTDCSGDVDAIIAAEAAIAKAEAAS